MIVLLHAYLINSHISIILNLFKLKSESLHIHDLSNNTKILLYERQLNDLTDHIYFELVVRLCLVALSIVFLVFFVVTSIKPLGNYPNDSVKFGRDFFSEKLLHNHINEISVSHTSLNTEKILSQKNRCCWFSVTNFLETLWRHFLPLSHFCHLVSIMLILFPRIVFIDSITSSTQAISGKINQIFSKE